MLISKVTSNGARNTNVFFKKSVCAGHFKNVEPFLVVAISLDKCSYGCTATSTNGLIQLK
jgi:hypothetical protein